LQHALYRAAKADPGRRFHGLYDKVSRSDVLWRAWVAVRRDNGAPGIDKTTLAQVEEYGVTRLLDELAAELKEGRYRPLPARRVYIPKPGAPAGEQRPLASCFSAIPHDKLMRAVGERVCDQPVLKLLRAMLRAGVMEDGQVRRPDTGAAQGGAISPVMCNVYLHRLDRAWDDGDGVLVRFADDLVVMCWSRSQAEAALTRLTALLADLGLEPKAAKTRIVHLEEGGEGFDFLGHADLCVMLTSLEGSCSRAVNGSKLSA
jgi:RNA-directed DNA polymerase